MRGHIQAKGKPRYAAGSMIAVVLVVAMATLCMAGCSGTGGSSASAANMEKKTVPLVFQKDEDTKPVESEMNLYFANGGDVPYVAVSEFMPFFGSIYENERLGNPAVEFTYEDASGVLWVSRTDAETSMLVDPNADTIEFTSYNSFMQPPNDKALVPIVNIGSTGYGGSMQLLQDAGTYNREGIVTTLKLADYDIDIVGANNEVYVPLQTMHDILLARNYYYTVFNGEKVYVFAYGCDLSEQINTVPTGKMSESFAEYNYNELVFLIDNFYGLKAEHGIDNTYKFILSTGLVEKLTSTDPEEFDMGLAELTMKYFDDSHSGFKAHSYLTESRSKTQEEALMDLSDSFGTSMTSTSARGMALMLSRSKYYPDLQEEKVFVYEEVGDTAIVTFDSFDVDKKDYYKDADLENPQDTIELIAKAQREITRKGSPIKNVVLDLSNNDGGDADAAAYVIAWFAGDRQLGMRDTLTGSQSVASFTADTNLDGTIDKNDTLYKKMYSGDINLYCLTASSSFSCGNLVPATFKGSGITLIGQTTGGGSCIVLPCMSACGTQFAISGTSQISTIKNGSFYNVDTGIEPDVPITRLDTFYDRTQLVDFIHGLK